jgi:hypothetical protein
MRELILPVYNDIPVEHIERFLNEKVVVKFNNVYETQCWLQGLKQYSQPLVGAPYQFKNFVVLCGNGFDFSELERFAASVPSEGAISSIERAK